MKRITNLLAAAALVCLSGCTPEKAEQLRIAALSFETQARQAIAAIEEMQAAELAPAPKSSAQKDEEFVQSMLKLDPGTPLDRETLETILDPDAVTLSAEVKKQRAAAYQGLKDGYSQFAAMFETLPNGSFLARKDVAAARKPALKLIAQLAAAADQVSERGPRLHQYWARIAAEGKALQRNKAKMSQDEFRGAALEFKGRLEALIVREAELQRATVERCLAAALVGKEMLPLIDGYGKLRIEDITGLVGKAMAVQEGLTGRPLSHLKGQLKSLNAVLDSEPELKAILQRGLAAQEEKQ